MDNNKLKNLEKLIEKKPSSFLSRFYKLKEKRKWLDYSSSIALHILEELRVKGLTQKALAEKLDVSAQQVNKIVKGNENLTLETISKLEEALNIKLIEIIDFKYVNEIPASVSEFALPRVSKMPFLPIARQIVKNEENKKKTLSTKFGYTKSQYVEITNSCEILPDAA